MTTANYFSQLEKMQAAGGSSEVEMLQKEVTRLKTLLEGRNKEVVRLRKQLEDKDAEINKIKRFYS